tara:strand:+ start:7676 stop:8347 length:672 start_codon:yes stop_codon:yes gene_type:complete
LADFWNQTYIEPKRSFQWVGYINFFTGNTISDGDMDFGPKPFLISNFTKPIFRFDNETLINNFTSQTEIITKNYVWEDTTLSVIDVQNVNANASNSVYRWLRSIGYESVQTLTQLSKLFSNLDNNKFSLKLEHIDSDGKPLERWTFIDPQVASIDFGGELNYDSEDVMKLNIGVTYVAADYENLQLPSINKTPGTARSAGGPQTSAPVGQSLIPGTFSPGGII